MISELLIIVGLIVGVYLGEDLSKLNTTFGALLMLGLVGGVVRFYSEVIKNV